MSGKVYSGEKAVISLTSWKKRIDTVGLTLFSLLKQCPGFHIVLVLSEEEFPKKEAELPKDIVTLVYTNKIEILWVVENVKSFKKVLYTLRKYPNVPIISSDDDCIYKQNYAQFLYDNWYNNKTCRFSLRSATRFGLRICGGCSTIFPPNCFSPFNVSTLTKIKHLSEDDMLYALLCQKLHINSISLNVDLTEYIDFANEIEPLHNIRRYDEGSDYYELHKYVYDSTNWTTYNIIGNSCISSWITTAILQQPFINPFSWCIMDFRSSYNLVKYFDTINWSKFELLNDKLNFSIRVDNLITIQYVHYKFDATADEPIYINGDVYYNKIWEYIVQKYVSRVKKMISYALPPIFVFACAKSATNKRSSFTVEQQRLLYECHSPYKIFLSFDCSYNAVDNCKSLTQHSNYTGNTKAMGIDLFTEIKNYL